MRRTQYFRSFAVALITLALLTACMPMTLQDDSGSTDYTRLLIIGAAVSIGTFAVTYLVRHALERALPQPAGVEGYRFVDDFTVDVTDGSFEVTFSGAAPPVGTFRGVPVTAARRADSANLAFAIRGQDDAGAQILMVSVLQQEAPTDTFTLVLVDTDVSRSDAGGQVARLTVGDVEDDPYVGEFSWTVADASACRVAGRFEAIGLMSASGAGPINVVGSFDVGANPVGTLAIVRR